MRKISEIYTEYKIMPNLKEHMYRVAGVASMICDNFDGEISKEDIVSACLLHDMGNIIKFKLGTFPEFLEPEGLEYWQGVQNEYIKKYGTDEHHATLEIAKEIGVSDVVISLINAIGFFNAPETALGSDFNKKIAAYCDDRVNPIGVVSLEQRLSDLRVRYAHKGGDTPARRAFENALQQIEPQIFAKCKIKPEYITDEKIKPIISELENFMIK